MLNKIQILQKVVYTMYKVYCQGKKHKKWQEYSQLFKKLEEAEECKKKAEALRTCDVDGNIIRYKIIKIK